MEARKGIICGLAASGVKPQLKQQQPQQEALNTEQERGHSDYLHYLRAIGAYNSAPVRRPQQQRQSSRGQSSRGNDVDEITRTEFRRSQGYLIRIEEPEEDIDPMFLHCMRALDSCNSALMRCPPQAQGQSSRTNGGRHY
ncbi:hypothetical protein IGI04_040465 [Brassica rapa subsp. trilocularis]|uniref:Uncharacterized protein n=1 Tax=Brassica rapa subsp. trilocularis TaxID=1813537 RepID=A0ABQ7KRF1_BRACM|nr:hypothetical protein IGI04_040465 [Brassica rapa subsp. trilocularis]